MKPNFETFDKKHKKTRFNFSCRLGLTKTFKVEPQNFLDPVLAKPKS